MRRMAKPKKYDHIDFRPPESVANAAERGLEYRRKQKGDKAGLSSQEAGAQGIGSGVQRAVNLKNRDEISPDTVRQMNRFFSRHEKNKSIDPKHKGEPWKDKGYVSWLLWGGDPGRSWVNKILRQMDAADEKEKSKKAAQLVREAGEILNIQKDSIYERDQENLRAEAEKKKRSRKSSENKPTNPSLWQRIQNLVSGDTKSINVDGKRIEGPNDGKGFKVHPSAYSNGWASALYGRLGGGWRKKKKKKKKKAILDVLKDPSCQELAKIAKGRGKAKKDVGHGGLDEWFSGHGGAKGKGEEARWGDWVSISPVERSLKKPDGKTKKIKPGDIVGPCGISDKPEWKEFTNKGKDPLKCMPRQKAYDMPKKERAEVAKGKMRAERKDKNTGKKPTRTPTFKSKK